MRLPQKRVDERTALRDLRVRRIFIIGSRRDEQQASSRNLNVRFERSKMG
jgi:hypothetical protein